MTQTYTTTILKITLVIAVVVVLFVIILRNDAVGSTFATGSGTGALDLTIDNKTFYNGALQPTLSWSLKNLVPTNDKFFNFSDVKPGDTGTTTISIHLKNSSAYVCLDFKNLKDEENGINEPESQLDNDNTGELSDEIEFFAWSDDGDNAFEIGEKPLFGTSTQMASVVLASTSYALSDYLNGPAFPVNQTKYVGITWCAGNLTVNLATAKITCDATAMGNEAQTDSVSMDVSLRAVSSTQQPTFTCVKPPKPVDQCEIEGHKYDSSGKPLENWTMGLMKVIKHNKGTDIYDLATDVTDADGYYCLNWDGEARTLRGVSTYKSGPYTFTYSVYEKLITGWKNVSIEKGPNFSTLSVVPNGDIKKDGVYVSTQIGEQNGYIYANAAYHVDFYNQLLKDKSKDVKKGKTGHNDKNNNAHNDDYPSGQINTDDFYQVSEDKTFSRKVKNSLNRFLSMFGNNNHG